MANQPRDPLEDVIADGRVYVRPVVHYGRPTILTVDLELLHIAITRWMHTIYLTDDRFTTRYGGCSEAVACLNADISTMADFAVGHAYNRLRGILKRTDSNELVTRMDTPCPVPKGMEFPAWISSLIGSIGPIRVSDGPVDGLLVYAPSAATMNSYGRTTVVTFSPVGHYYRLLGVMKEIGINVAPVDHDTQTGSAFPTIAVELKQNMFTLYGTIHRSHYENEDIARAIFCTNENGVTPFQQIGTTIGYVDDEATINALASAHAPKGIPEAQTAISAGRPVAGHFNVNYFGIRPPVPATETAPSQPAGMYVIGRGVERYWQCILAQELSMTETCMLSRFRLTRCS